MPKDVLVAPECVPLLLEIDLERIDFVTDLLIIVRSSLFQDTSEQWCHHTLKGYRVM